MIEISTKFLPYTRNELINWCEEYISPQTYWIHNKIGGYGWMYLKKNRSDLNWCLRIEDDQIATIFRLKFGV